MRNAVYLASIPAPAFGPADFGNVLGQGDAPQQVQIPQYALSEWRDMRLQIFPDRLQLGFLPSAGAELIQSALEEFLRRAGTVSATARVGFNAALRFDLAEGDADPSRNLFDADDLAARVGGTGARSGFTLIYRDDSSRWWIELTPEPDTEGSWLFDINRQFDNFPVETGERAEIFDWFKQIERNLLEQYETITAVGASS